MSKYLTNAVDLWSAARAFSIMCHIQTTNGAPNNIVPSVVRNTWAISVEGRQEIFLGGTREDERIMSEWVLEGSGLTGFCSGLL
jgi:hypothetical protein